MNSYEGLDKATAEALQNEILLCSDCQNEITTDEEVFMNDHEEQICENCSDNYYSCHVCGDLNSEEYRYSFREVEYCEDCYNEHVQTCNACGNEDETVDMVYDDYDGYICDECSSDYNQVPDWNVFSNNFVNTDTSFVSPNRDKYSSDSFKLIPSKRYMGIEIETNFKQEVYFQDLSDDLKYNIASTRINFDNADEFMYLGRLSVVSDGSVRRGEHEHGLEVVLDPRRGDILHKDITTICENLKEGHGAYVSRHCGLHLHIDCRDYDWYHFALLSLMVKYIEPHIYTWVPQSRLNGSGGTKWCKPLSQSFEDFKYVGNRNDFVNFWYDNGGFTNDKYNNKRYHGFNLHSHFQANQGIEIRYHGGTLNPDKIKHWSIFWSNVVDTSYNIAEKMWQENSSDLFSETSIMQSLWKKSIDGKIKHMLDEFSIDSPTRDIDDTKNPKKTIDIKKYVKQSEVIRRYLKLPKQDKPYLLQPMLNHILRRQSQAVMSIDNIFDTFNIPTETQEFMRVRMGEIMNSDYTSRQHIKNCFHGKSNIIEFNKKTLSFDYIDNLHNQFPTIDNKELENVYDQRDIQFIIDMDSRDIQLQNYMM